MMVVRTKEDKEKLGKAMMLGNERFINTSSATVMFLADLRILLNESFMTRAP